ncbi:hypothetical protein SADUNF_Sadunf09G0077800 [Salix dunnii]|uniref:Reticulon-like protein n=1 Tax=Salix dunnii TaxID=1413687 RepID=A0A835JVN2_9ROSI|nr:hypothetical protein SADUNF_Sadunf09G0077800 [Salix dunnii]
MLYELWLMCCDGRDATTLWILVERAGYSLSSPSPPLPKLEIPEQIVAKAASVIREYANYALSIARVIVIDKKFKSFPSASYIGSLCIFLTLVYIGVLLILSAPLMYDKHQHRIDEKLCLAPKIIQAQHMKIDDVVLKKIPLPSNKEKKTWRSIFALLYLEFLQQIEELIKHERAIKNLVESLSARVPWRTRAPGSEKGWCLLPPANETENGALKTDKAMELDLNEYLHQKHIQSKNWTVTSSDLLRKLEPLQPATPLWLACQEWLIPFPAGSLAVFRSFSESRIYPNDQNTEMNAAAIPPRVA